LYTSDNTKQTKDQPDRTITGKKPSDASFDETGTVKTTELDRLELEALTEQEKMSVNLKKNLKQMKKFMRLKSSIENKDSWQDQQGKLRGAHQNIMQFP